MLTLFTEVKNIVLNYLSVDDLLNLSKVSKKYRKFMEHPALWHDRIRELGPFQVDGPLTKSQFIPQYQMEANALAREIKHLLKNKAAILNMEAALPFRTKIVQEFNLLERTLESLKHYKVNLKMLDRILTLINNRLIIIQNPQMKNRRVQTQRHLQLNFITRLDESWITDYCKRFPQNPFEHRLQYLNLRYSGLRQLPENIKNFKYLESLNLYDTKLVALPECLKEFKYLRNLYLSDCPMTEIPEVVFKIQSLEALSILDMPIQHLPGAIGALKNLHTFYLMNTEVAVLPVECVLLSKLRTVALNQNQLIYQQAPEILNLFKLLKVNLPNLISQQKGNPQPTQNETELFDLTTQMNQLTLRNAHSSCTNNQQPDDPDVVNWTQNKNKYP